MANNKFDQAAISFRPAKPEDAKAASRLLFETFPKKAAFIMGLGDANRAKSILRDLFKIPGHRLSHSVTQVALHQGRIIGLITVFPGKQLGRLNRKLDWLVLGRYALRGKIAVIVRGWPMVFIKEATRKEYFLSNLAVRKHFRSQGAGEIMLGQVEEAARTASLDRVSLMVHIENQRARQFYQRLGFETTAIHLESNTRVPHLGAGYYRMIKELAQG